MARSALKLLLVASFAILAVTANTELLSTIIDAKLDTAGAVSKVGAAAVETLSGAAAGAANAAAQDAATKAGLAAAAAARAEAAALRAAGAKAGEALRLANATAAVGAATAQAAYTSAAGVVTAASAAAQAEADAAVTFAGAVKTAATHKAEAAAAAALSAANATLATADAAKRAAAAAAADAAVVAGRIAHTKLDAALTVANATLAAADAAKRAAAAAAADAAVVAGRIAHAKVDAALTVANATLAAAQAAKKAASDAAAVASGLAVGAAQFGVGAAQLGSQAVYGGAYDVVDMMMLRPLVDAPKGFTPAGTGYCFPRWTSANVTVARIGCPPGHALSAVGCVRKTARATQTCFSGPECVAPFNATADAPVCLDDKVQEVIVGVLALHKAGLKAPYGVGRALALFSGESANASLALLRESFELHVGAAAAAVGVGSAFVGADGRALVDLGSRLMAFDWPALPDFNKLYESVNKAVRAVPEEVVDEVRAVAPACLRRCCKPDTAIDTAVARPSLTCPNGGRLEPVGLLCIGDGGAAGALPGYGKCPAGMKACLLSSWGRPLCAAQDRVLGVESCAALEVLALAHKLPKLACPGAA
ncbi:hypothetical protein Rsub_00020 [Raphidocelis subcapitata]|uniref:Uncharacterized protein n=1 Tax=Raphidocelis subcapitata TaxID=307507 RepID=A0A2V0NK15_9CHLO|nr:hypothetical protein Rsub_00020 [Raphidocelis subcapitata]|eukprot:GBF87309.1 hypothetical protein Rsub_00020 [Raphidocelis subcapitata]